MLFSTGDSGYARCCAKNKTQKLSRQRACCQLHNRGSLKTPRTGPTPELGQIISKAYVQLCVSTHRQILNSFDNIFGNVKILEKSEAGILWGYSWSTVRSYNFLVFDTMSYLPAESYHSQTRAIPCHSSQCKVSRVNLNYFWPILSLYVKTLLWSSACSAGTRPYRKGAGGVMTLETTAAAYGLILWSPILNRNKVHFHSKPIVDFLYRLKTSLREKWRQNRWSAVGKKSGNSGQTQMEISFFGSPLPEIYFWTSVGKGRVELQE